MSLLFFFHKLNTAGWQHRCKSELNFTVSAATLQDILSICIPSTQGDRFTVAWDSLICVSCLSRTSFIQNCWLRMIYVQKYVDSLPTRSYITFQRACALICCCNCLHSSASRRSTRFWNAPARDSLPFSHESIKWGRTLMSGDKARLARRLNSSQNCWMGLRSIVSVKSFQTRLRKYLLILLSARGRCHVEKQEKRPRATQLEARHCLNCNSTVVEIRL